MPWLINRTDQDLFAPQLHRIVPAQGTVAITEAEGTLFRDNSMWSVVEDSKSVEPEQRSATRRTITRGAQRVEIDTAPPMETR